MKVLVVICVLNCVVVGCGQAIELTGRTVASTVNPKAATDGPMTDDVNGVTPTTLPPAVKPAEPPINVPPPDGTIDTSKPLPLPPPPLPTIDIPPPVVPTVIPPGAGFYLDYDFVSEQRATRADVVWTVDNSTSMAEEAENVRVNFDSFVSRLASVADVKMGLISSSVFNSSSKIFGLKMSDELLSNGHFQFDVIATGVGSWNLFSFAAISSCAANRSNVLSDPWDTTICGRRSSNPQGSKIEEEAYLDRAKGKLVNFYRPGAKRIFIFVTDDESRHFKAVDFKAVMDAQVPNNYHVFGFIGNTNDKRCNADATGNDYNSLASDTHGLTFPICDSNWTPHFDTLVSSIFQLIEKGYEIPQDTKVTQVLVDDVEIDRSLYVVETDGKLYFKKGVIKKAGQKIKMTVRKDLN